MKEKIIIFLVGLLLGAIISTGSIYVYTKANVNGNNNDMKMEMPGDKGQNGMMEEGSAPPEIPNN